MATGIILAGGYSSRAKTNKMALKILDKPLLQHTIEAMKDCVDAVIVVSGYYHEALKPLIKPYESATLIHNPYYDQGMFESVKCGIKHASNSVLIQPGDMPFIKKSTYQALLNTQGKIGVPTHKGKRGHPIYIDMTLKRDLLNTKEPHLKAFRNLYAVQEIPVDDAGILIDIDTKADYLKFREGLKDED